MAASSPSERDVEDRGGDPQMLRHQGLELVAGTGTRRAAPAAPASVLRQMPETIRDTSQLESHPAENAVVAFDPRPGRSKYPSRLSGSNSARSRFDSDVAPLVSPRRRI